MLYLLNIENYFEENRHRRFSTIILHSAFCILNSYLPDKSKFEASVCYLPKLDFGD